MKKILLALSFLLCGFSKAPIDPSQILIRDVIDLASHTPSLPALPVVFHIVNHNHFDEGIPPSVDEIRDWMRDLAFAMGPCGVTPYATEIRYWDAPHGDFNLVTVKTTMKLGAVNVYFMGGDFGSFSYDEVDAWHRTGIAVISDYDRLNAHLRQWSVPHEIAHASIAFSHDHSGRINLLADQRSLLGPYLNINQCGILRDSLYLER